MTVSKFKGMDKVVSNLRKEIKKINGHTLTGLMAAGETIKSESMTLTPVDTGNLRASHYVEGFKRKKGPLVEIGATAFYAPFVHEQLENSHEVGQAKFLEAAIINMKSEVLRLIRKFAKV